MAVLTQRGDDADLPDVARAWTRARLPFRGLHLDSAAAGCCSAEVLRAAADHAVLEAQVGAYIAQAQAAPVLDAGRAALAGLLGAPAPGLAFVESASVALATLLSAWPLREGDAVAVVPSEWGPSLAAFADHGLRITELAVLPDGLLDLRPSPRAAAGRRPAGLRAPDADGLAPPAGPAGPAGRGLVPGRRGSAVGRCRASPRASRDRGRRGRHLRHQPQMADRPARCRPAGRGRALVGPADHPGAAPAARHLPFSDQLPSFSCWSRARRTSPDGSGSASRSGQHLDAGPSLIWERLSAVGRARPGRGPGRPAGLGDRRSRRCPGRHHGPASGRRGRTSRRSARACWPSTRSSPPAPFPLAPPGR